MAATVTLTDTARAFPSGTTVGAYQASRQVAGQPPSGAALATATSSGSTVTFTGLPYNTDYVAYAQVGGSYNYLHFRTGDDPKQGFATQQYVDDSIAAGGGGGGGGSSDDFISLTAHGPSEDGTRVLAQMDCNFSSGSATSGSHTISCTAAGTFGTTDVGKTLLMTGAGTAGADLLTTITAVNPGVSWTVQDAVGTTVGAGTQIIWGTDDTAAWQAAIDLAHARRGGNIVCRPPVIPAVAGSSNYPSLVRSTITISDWKGGGIYGQAGNGDAFPRLEYVGATGSCLHIQSALSLHMEGLSFNFAQQGFNGDLVLADTNLSDNMYLEIYRCNFGGGPDQDPVANSLLKINDTIFSHVDFCGFSQGAQSGIELGPNYFNACSITRCSFSHVGRQIYLNSADAEALTIDRCTFEPAYGGVAHAIVGSNTCSLLGGAITNNWFGDADTGGHCWIENVTATGAINFTGNTMSSPGPGVSGFGGAHFNVKGGPWEIHGNTIVGGHAVFDLLNMAGQSTQINFHDNRFSLDQTGGAVLFANGTLSDVPIWRCQDNMDAGGNTLILPETRNLTPVKDAQIGDLAYPLTIDWSHMGKRLLSSPNTTQWEITIPPESTTFFPAGTRFFFAQMGTGKIHFNAGAGVTLRSKGALVSSNGQYSVVTLEKLVFPANNWLLSGDLS